LIDSDQVYFIITRWDTRKGSTQHCSGIPNYCFRHSLHPSQISVHRAFILKRTLDIFRSNNKEPLEPMFTKSPPSNMTIWIDMTKVCETVSIA
jgi:hypothetical protein